MTKIGFWIFQRTLLLKNLQDQLFWTSTVKDSVLRQAKSELMLQIQHFIIAINCKGFFEVNRSLLLSVRLLIKHPMHGQSTYQRIKSNYYSRWQAQAVHTSWSLFNFAQLIKMFEAFETHSNYHSSLIIVSYVAFNSLKILCPYTWTKRHFRVS